MKWSPRAPFHSVLIYSTDVTAIFFGSTAARFGIMISNTPSLDFADIASEFAVSGKLKRRWKEP
jgi:hypothetical protein